MNENGDALVLEIFEDEFKSEIEDILSQQGDGSDSGSAASDFESEGDDEEDLQSTEYQSGGTEEPNDIEVQQPRLSCTDSAPLLPSRQGAWKKPGPTPLRQSWTEAFSLDDDLPLGTPSISALRVTKIERNGAMALDRTTNARAAVMMFVHIIEYVISRTPYQLVLISHTCL